MRLAITTFAVTVALICAFSLAVFHCTSEAAAHPSPTRTEQSLRNQLRLMTISRNQWRARSRYFEEALNACRKGPINLP